RIPEFLDALAADMALAGRLVNQTP
ncbi:MAG: hypothetical protein H6Q05_4421, partial [Acidobacteria bacterium]|nr:hypothetical protein [Acidobacteriota bacterium]